jgi:hypothetical protein
VYLRGGVPPVPVHIAVKEFSKTVPPSEGYWILTVGVPPPDPEPTTIVPLLLAVEESLLTSNVKS